MFSQGSRNQSRGPELIAVSVVSCKTSANFLLKYEATDDGSVLTAQPSRGPIHGGSRINIQGGYTLL